MSPGLETGLSSIHAEREPAWDWRTRNFGPPSPVAHLRNRLPSIPSSHSVFGVPMSLV